MNDSPPLFRVATILWALFLALVLSLALLVVPRVATDPVVSTAPAIDVMLSATGEVDQSQIPGVGFAGATSQDPQLAATRQP